jgi:hypothetical protein
MTTWLVIAASVFLALSFVVPVKERPRSRDLIPGYFGLAGMAIAGVAVVIGDSDADTVAAVAVAIAIAGLATAVFFVKMALADEEGAVPPQDLD